MYFKIFINQKSKKSMFSFKTINWAAILVTFIVIVAATVVTAKMISYKDEETGAEMKASVKLPGEKE